MKHPRRYALFFGEEEEAYFAGTAAECKQYIRESGTRRGWHYEPLALCSRQQTASATAEMLIADREPKNPLWGTITTEADMLRKTARVVGFTE